MRALTNVALAALNLTFRSTVRIVLGPDIADRCDGHDDSLEDCYSDSRGVWRCRTCAMRLEA